MPHLHLKNAQLRPDQVAKMPQPFAGASYYFFCSMASCSRTYHLSYPMVVVMVVVIVMLSVVLLAVVLSVVVVVVVCAT